MLRSKMIAMVVGTGLVAFSGAYAGAEEFSARLNGFEELGAINNNTGAVLSDGSGTAKLKLNRNGDAIFYSLTYSNVGATPPLTGTVTQAHIHFGKARDAGGILVFFCTNLPFAGSGPTPPSCPENGGTVKGTFTAASVQGIATQNVVAGDFNALVDALTSDTAYANIHTTALPAGEIRGQCRSDDRKDRDGRQEH
jgi:hypothetical protein